MNGPARTWNAVVAGTEPIIVSQVRSPGAPSADQ
jgi:hypothetical protein